MKDLNKLIKQEVNFGIIFGIVYIILNLFGFITCFFYTINGSRFLLSAIFMIIIEFILYSTLIILSKIDQRYFNLIKIMGKEKIWMNLRTKKKR